MRVRSLCGVLSVSVVHVSDTLLVTWGTVWSHCCSRRGASRRRLLTYTVRVVILSGVRVVFEIRGNAANTAVNPPYEDVLSLEARSAKICRSARPLDSNPQLARLAHELAS